MFRRVMELAAQLVCVAALSVMVVERRGEGMVKKREAISLVKQFREQSESSATNGSKVLAGVMYSDLVLSWLVDSLVSVGNEIGILERVRS